VLGRGSELCEPKDREFFLPGAQAM
jgi:hypothetical protein